MKIGRSLQYTALILAGNQTEVAFSAMILLDHQDLHTVNTVSMNRYQTAYIIYENLSLNNWVTTTFKRQHNTVLTSISAMWQIAPKCTKF